MKNSTKWAFAGLVCGSLGFFSMTTAHAQILLTIDDSVASQVTITATGALSSNTTVAGLIADGIDLSGFFTTAITPDITTSTLSSTLTVPADSTTGPYFNEEESDRLSTSSYVDLNLFHNNSFSTISFTAGQTAFSGTLTFDLTGQPLPAIGTIGTIESGYSDSPHSVIGEYEVVPEPATSALLVVCLGALAYFGRQLRPTPIRAASRAMTA